MKTKLAMALCLAIQICAASGQENRPPKQPSKSELEAAFNDGLKLDQIPQGAIELGLLSILPSEKDIEKDQLFFRDASRIALDDRGHFYIPQGYPLGAITELDSEGRLVRRFNRNGQGPGDIQSPMYVMFYNRQVIVCDTLTRRMSFFDRNWEYLRSFSLPQPGRSFVLGSNGQFYFGNLRGEKLVSSMDMEGKLLDSFGDRPSNGGIALNAFVLGAAPGGSIWVGMEALGILKRYSANGHLEREIDIVTHGSGLIKNYLKENWQWAEKGIPRSHEIIKDITFEGDDVWVLTGGIVQPLYRFDGEGQLKGTYYIKPEMERSLGSVGIGVAKNGDQRIYIWQIEPDLDEPRIGVYGIKKDKN